MTQRISIPELTAAEFTRQMVAVGQPAYRARQVLRWLYRRGAACFEEMTDLPLALRTALAGRFAFFQSRVTETRSAADGTAKLLIELADGHLIETVLIPQADRRTACVSTSVGCAFRCVFCASGLTGQERLLTAGEMVEQVLHAMRTAQVRNAECGMRNGEQQDPTDPLRPPESVPHSPLPTPHSAFRTPQSAITHIVVMGVGEPLANLEALERFIRIINDPAALRFGARRITISTIGLPEGIRAVADWGLQVNLAISLHAPDDDLRSQLVPANRTIGIDAILDAAADYFARTGRRVTYEYCLLGGVNDSDDHARRLARRLRRAPGLVNVIPYNRVLGLPYRPPTSGRVGRFVEVLRREGVEAQVRRRRGERIQAACGQLRADRSETGNYGRP